jgi:hypothetical protein
VSKSITRNRPSDNCTNVQPPDRREGTLPFGPQPIPVTWFARLHNALAGRDYALARRATRELRTLGYSVVALDRSKGGR